MTTSTKTKAPSKAAPKGADLSHTTAKTSSEDNKPTSDVKPGQGEPKVTMVVPAAQVANTLNPPLRVDGVSRKTIADAMQGHFCTVTGGKHQGLYGVFEEVSEVDKDGYPTKILFKTRDARNELLEIPYKDVTAAETRGNAPR